MILLKLIFTRPGVVPVIQGWYEGVGEYLKKVVGVEIVEQALYFQKGVIRCYRSDCALNRVRKFILQHPERIMAQLQMANTIYNDMRKNSRQPTSKSLKNYPEILNEFYKNFLDSWRANFFGLWVPSLTQKKELGKYGRKLFRLAYKVRKSFDPFVFAGGYYKRVIKLIGKDKKFLSLCTHTELVKHLSQGLAQKEQNKILKRNQGFIIVGGKAKVVKSFAEAQRFVRQFGYKIEKEPTALRTSVFKGQVASKGKVKGRVKLLFTYDDNKKVRKGDIVVSPMTTPVFMPALYKAAAIITDEGGITCHAAIVSREMKKPCIIGTKIATKVLKDGQLVEVDANKGIVRLIK